MQRVSGEFLPCLPAELIFERVAMSILVHALLVIELKLVTILFIKL